MIRRKLQRSYIENSLQTMGRETYGLTPTKTDSHPTLLARAIA